jgi:hypothetical protein
MALDWVDVLKIAAASSVGAAGLNHLFDFLVRRTSLRRDSRYVAQRVAIILEKFAIDCADTIAGNDLHRQSDGHAGRRSFKLPNLPDFPIDADWKAVDPVLAGRALAMYNELVLSGHKIYFWWDVVGDEDSMETETNEQAGKCGYRAWELATEFRKGHGLPKAELTGWDFVAVLKEHHDSAITRLKEAD